MPPAAPRRILLAEDNEVNRRVAIGLVERLGCEVQAVANGRQAVEALDYSRHDLILMDVQMPEMDGLAAAALIRRRERGTGRHIPIIAMTAHAMQGDRERCLAAGMDGYIAKPIRPGPLREALLAQGTRVEPPPAEADRRADLPFVAFSPAALEESCGADPGLAREVLGVMLDGVPAGLGRLEAAVAAGDAGRVAREAHSLKGAFLTVGATALAATCQELTTLARRGDLAGIEAISRSIRDQWGWLEEEARRCIDTMTVAAGATAP
jgi:CheY-like chemotaxis protein